jgi:predicted metal-binding protein/SAM-dependent methyltransferase
MPLANPPDPAQSDYSHLEDLACGYWGSEVFFTALNFDLFSKLGTGTNDLTAFAAEHDFAKNGLERLFPALLQLGLVENENGYWFPTTISRTYLDTTSPDCMVDFFLYRQYMQEGWHNLGTKIGPVPQPKITPKSPYCDRNFYYVKALDLLARQKGAEIVKLVQNCNWRGEILDIGGGAGALCRTFLAEKPEQCGTVFDLAEVHDAARKLYSSHSDWQNINYIDGDFLHHDFNGGKKYGLILMANFLHAYDKKTSRTLLQKACSLLAEDGFLIIHDYFPDRQTDRSAKAVLYDLHMLSNTYNGACHLSSEIHSWLRDSGVEQAETVDLSTDSSLIVASPSQVISFGVNWTQVAQGHGFRTGIMLDPRDVITAPWVALKCRFGCKKHGQGLQCPPFSMDEEKTRKLLDSYSQCLLVESTPPGAQFHRQLLDLERTAFLNGNHKAFVLGAGPCTLCTKCDTTKPCIQPEKARPAMEACGIDVYGTMQRAGMELTPMKGKSGYVKYVGLLLID